MLFLSVISIGPSRAHGPSAGPAEANDLPEAHGPSKFHGPRGHCTPPSSPLGGPGTGTQAYNYYIAGIQGCVSEGVLDRENNKRINKNYFFY